MRITQERGGLTYLRKVFFSSSIYTAAVAICCRPSHSARKENFVECRLQSTTSSIYSFVFHRREDRCLALYVLVCSATVSVVVQSCRLSAAAANTLTHRQDVRNLRVHQLPHAQAEEGGPRHAHRGAPEARVPRLRLRRYVSCFFDCLNIDLTLKAIPRQMCQIDKQSSIHNQNDLREILLMKEDFSLDFHL